MVDYLRSHGGAIPAETIRQRLELPTRIVNDVLYQLVQAGQLLAVPMTENEREMAYIPAHDIASLTVYGILEAVEQSGQECFVPTPTPELQRIDREVEYLKRCARESKDNVKIVELLGNEKPKVKN